MYRNNLGEFMPRKIRFQVVSFNNNVNKTFLTEKENAKIKIQLTEIF